MEAAISESEAYGLSVEQRRHALEAARVRQGVRGDGRALGEPRIVQDVLLAYAYRLGNVEAVDAMHRTYRPLVRNIARRYCKPDEVAEVEAEMWAGLWEKLHGYVGMSSLRTWLNVVVRNWCVDRCRATPPPGPDWNPDEESSPLERVPAPGPTPDESSTCLDFSASLDASTRGALLRLDPRDRVLLRLRYVHEMNLEALRQRPEIYAEGDGVLPVYGLTRRLQRIGRALREVTLQGLAARGWSPDACVEMIADCEGVSGEVGRALFRFLDDDALQFSPAAPSAGGKEHDHA